MYLHYVGGHRTDHGPKHVPGTISDEGSRDGKKINRSKDETAVRRHTPHAQNRLTGTGPVTEFLTLDGNGGHGGKTAQF